VITFRDRKQGAATVTHLFGCCQLQWVVTVWIQRRDSPCGNSDFSPWIFDFSTRKIPGWVDTVTGTSCFWDNPDNPLTHFFDPSSVLLFFVSFEKFKFPVFIQFVGVHLEFNRRFLSLPQVNP
jgi:hypothetical protein